MTEQYSDDLAVLVPNGEMERACLEPIDAIHVRASCEEGAHHTDAVANRAPRPARKVES